MEIEGFPVLFNLLLCPCITSIKIPWGGNRSKTSEEDWGMKNHYTSNTVLGGDRGKSEEVYLLDGSQIVSVT